jgi:hypothetical protein
MVTGAAEIQLLCTGHHFLDANVLPSTNRQSVTQVRGSAPRTR